MRVPARPVFALTVSHRSRERCEKCENRRSKYVFAPCSGAKKCEKQGYRGVFAQVSACFRVRNTRSEHVFARISALKTSFSQVKWCERASSAHRERRRTWIHALRASLSRDGRVLVPRAPRQRRTALRAAPRACFGASRTARQVLVPGSERFPGARTRHVWGLWTLNPLKTHQRGSQGPLSRFPRSQTPAVTDASSARAGAACESASRSP